MSEEVSFDSLELLLDGGRDHGEDKEGTEKLSDANISVDDGIDMSDIAQSRNLEYSYEPLLSRGNGCHISGIARKRAVAGFATAYQVQPSLMERAMKEGSLIEAP